MKKKTKAELQQENDTLKTENLILKQELETAKNFIAENSRSILYATAKTCSTAIQHHYDHKTKDELIEMIRAIPVRAEQIASIKEN